MKFKNIIISSLLLTITFLDFGQIPQVPDNMTFAGIELSIDQHAKEEIQKSVDKLHANTSYFNRMTDLADLYFPIIEAEFAKTGFPDEIKYLCIQESAFRADAVSVSNAIGYWQFKEATAIEQGMLVNHNFDERKNIVSSSFAAARYITAHNKALNNWVYSVIAFNTGLGGVKSFYDAKYAGLTKMDIDKHTHWYFLKLLAHIVAFENHVGKKQHPLVLKIHNETSGKTLQEFADLNHVALADIVPYNLWTREDAILCTEKNIPVIVPVPFNMYHVATTEPTKPKEEKPAKEKHKKEEKTAHKQPHKKEISKSETTVQQVPDSKKEESISIKKETAPKENVRYTVNKIPAITAIEGDNSSKLAIKGGISIDDFLKYNEIKNFEDLVIGQTYFLKKKKNKSATLYHTAQYGESLWDISQLYGINEAALRRKNRISKFGTIEPGRVLYLNTLREETTPIEHKPLEKPVEKVTPEPVIKITEKKVEVLSLDTTAIIEVKDENPAKFIHWVQPQETLAMIAYLYQVDTSEIKTWNNITTENVAVGTKLKIYDSEKVFKIIKDSTTSEITPQVINPKTPEPVQPTVAPVQKQPTPPTSTVNPIALAPTQFKTIIVEPGTTLYGLTRQYGISVDELKKYNTIPTNSLNAGDSIRIPIYEKSSTTDTFKSYTIQQGDTFYSVSKKLGVSVEHIKNINKKTDNSLNIGEVIRY